MCKRMLSELTFDQKKKTNLPCQKAMKMIAQIHELLAGSPYSPHLAPAIVSRAQISKKMLDRSKFSSNGNIMASK